MTVRWRKASKPGPCTVCGATTWALACALGEMGVRRCMMHGLPTPTQQATDIVVKILLSTLNVRPVHRVVMEFIE